MTIFEDQLRKFNAQVASDPKLQAQFDFPWCLVIEGQGGGVWLFEKGGVAQVVANPEAISARCTLLLPLKTLERIITSQQTPQQAFLSGELRVRGDLTAALTLYKFFDKLVSPV